MQTTSSEHHPVTKDQRKYLIFVDGVAVTITVLLQVWKLSS